MFFPFSSLIDISPNDWDEKEQEGLREVEKILDRADEILGVRNVGLDDCCHVGLQLVIIVNIGINKLSHNIKCPSQVTRAKILL